MPDTMDRPGYEGGGVAGLEEYFTRMLQRNPSFRPPRGYRIDGDRVVRDEMRGPLDAIGRAGQIAGIGAMGIGGLGLAGVGPAAAAGAGGSTIAGTSIPVASGVPAGMPGAVSGVGGAATAAGAGGGGWLDFLKNPGNLMELFGDVGGVLGGAARGAAEGRALEGDMLARRDLAQNQQYGVRQNAEFQAADLDLRRQQDARSARSTNARQGVIGNLLANVQDANISVPGVPAATLTGGLRPSALGAGGRQSAAELARQAMLRQMDPETYTGGNIIEPPTLSSIPEASGWERGAGAGGTILSILGALGGRRPSTAAPVRS